MCIGYLQECLAHGKHPKVPIVTIVMNPVSSRSHCFRLFFSCSFPTNLRSLPTPTFHISIQGQYLLSFWDRLRDYLSVGHEGGWFNIVLPLLHAPKLRIALLQSEELPGTHHCLGL